MLAFEDININKVNSYPSGAQMTNEDRQDSKHFKGKGQPWGVSPDSFYQLSKAGQSTLPFRAFFSQLQIRDDKGKIKNLYHLNIIK